MTLMEPFEFEACFPPETEYPVKPSVKHPGLVNIRMDGYGAMDLTVRLMALGGTKFKVKVFPGEEENTPA